MAQGIFNLKQVNQAIRQGAWSAFNPPQFVEYLVVAGGGGGQTGGGGGAGGALTGMVPVTAGASYTVTVGGGGSNGGGGAAVQGVTGTNSVFGSIIATGGGGGASYSGTTTGKAGGSGGGGYNTSAGGQGTANQGNAGATGNSVTTASGGGGGAGSMGLNPLPANGTVGTAISGGGGGAGVASAISGAIMTYAGGGGGGASGSATLRSNGGIGGGGVGCLGGDALNTTGNVNTGGGGGGGFYVNSDGKAGGSGIVIVRYPGTVQFYTGGTVGYANGYIVHTFYANGTLASTTPTQYSNTYQISRSLRFNSADSAYLNRTPGSASNRRTFTWSGWVKRSNLASSSEKAIFIVGPTLTEAGYFNIAWSSDKFVCGTGAVELRRTTSLYRDVSAWYHLVVAIDTTQSGASDRVKMYVNGVEVTVFDNSANPTLNVELSPNNTVAHNIGRNVYNSSNHYDGYMTDVHFIDGQQLTPSSFGEYDVNTGVWIPRSYGGSYGTNGFKVNFSDNSNTTAATLGADSSGNGNNYTPNNFSVTAGVGNDSLVDTPTQYGTDTGAGAEVRGNYCTWNPLVKPYGTNTYTNGNLDVVPNGNWNAVVGTIGITTGKWYWEILSSIQDLFIGIQPIGQDYTTINPQNFNGVFVCDDNQKLIDGTRTAYTATGHGAGVIVGVAVDLDAGLITFYKNGVSQGAINFASSLTFGKTVLPTIIPYYPGYVMTANFGQRAFSYTAPTGFKALCTTNLPTPTIGATAATQANKFFAPITYTGNGTTTQQVAVGFQPDFVWQKCRSTGYAHYLQDSVRGANKVVRSASTAAQTTETDAIMSFNANGYTVGGSAGTNYVNDTYVAWNWKASNATAVTNTAGSITSSVSANPTSGFSVVTYTGTGANATIGHGLGAVPSVIITKNLTQAGNYFAVYTSMVGNTKTLWLSSDDVPPTSSQYWNNTTPISSVFSVGSAGPMNGSTHSMLAYCFAPIAGYSAFGSYTGNGSANGPFAHTGFRPAFILIKNTTATGYWLILDVARNTYNAMTSQLWPNGNDVENNTYGVLDAVSNGFKLRDTAAGYNDSASVYIYMAFASHPFKYSLAR